MLYVMQIKERNERGGNGDAPVTSSGLGKEGSNFKAGGLGKERDCSQSTVY